MISQQNIRPRDEALVGQLLEQISFLHQKIAAQEPLTSQEELKLADLQSMAAELGVELPEKRKLTHRGQKIRSFCFAHSTNDINEESVLCPVCGSQQVQPKGQKGRTKRYIDSSGQWQEIEVHRYRCQNEECNQRDFTHLPQQLLPHSPYSVGIRLERFAYPWGTSLLLGGGCWRELPSCWNCIRSQFKPRLPLGECFWPRFTADSCSFWRCAFQWRGWN